MSLDSLMPCPMCGNKGEIIYDEEYGTLGGYHASCIECPVMTDTLRDRMAVIDAWNTRPKRRNATERKNAKHGPKEIRHICD